MSGSRSATGCFVIVFQMCWRLIHLATIFSTAKKVINLRTCVRFVTLLCLFCTSTTLLIIESIMGSPLESPFLVIWVGWTCLWPHDDPMTHSWPIRILHPYRNHSDWMSSWPNESQSEYLIGLRESFFLLIKIQKDR